MCISKGSWADLYKTNHLHSFIMHHLSLMPNSKCNQWEMSLLMLLTSFYFLSLGCRKGSSREMMKQTVLQSTLYWSQEIQAIKGGVLPRTVWLTAEQKYDLVFQGVDNTIKWCTWPFRSTQIIISYSHCFISLSHAHEHACGFTCTHSPNAPRSCRRHTRARTHTQACCCCIFAFEQLQLYMGACRSHGLRLLTGIAFAWRWVCPGCFAEEEENQSA